MLQGMCGVRGQFTGVSPLSTTWVLGIKLNLSSLAASAYTC